jgi:hypothetical protein
MATIVSNEYVLDPNTVFEPSPVSDPMTIQEANAMLKAAEYKQPAKQHPAKQHPTKQHPAKQHPAKQHHKHPWCGCYNKESTDARCCGLCYCFCPAKHINRTIDKDRCDFCPETFTAYRESGYFITYGGYGRHNNDDDCFCTTICLPFKIPVFSPCILGSLFNSLLNYCCYLETENRNYLL